MIWRIGLGVSLTVALTAVTLAAGRAAELERLEVNAGRATTLAEADAGGTATLLSAELYPRTTAQFELCASDPMRADRWADTLELQIRLDGEVGVQVPLDASTLAGVRRDEVSACLEVGHGPVYTEGQYTIVAVYDPLPAELADVPLRVRVAARPQLDDLDLSLVLSIWLGSILIVIFLAGRAKAGELDLSPRAARATSAPGDERVAGAESRAEGSPRTLAGPLRGWIAVLIGLSAMVLGFVGIGFVSAEGAAGGLATGVALGAYEVALALLLIANASMARRLGALAMVRPTRRWWLWFPGAALGGLVLMLLAQLSTQLVPSTAQSSVEAFVAWPSGLLSFAALAVAAPLAEEAFFRGFVYGALERYGLPVAFAAAWLLFVAFHGAQTWGQWGALVGIAVTGLGLTTLRALSGSALVAATAHLVYNGLLAVQAFL